MRPIIPRAENYDPYIAVVFSRPIVKKKNCISSIHSCIPDNGDNIASLTSGSIPNDFYDVILCVAIPTPYKIDPFSRGSNVRTDKYTRGWKTMGTRDTWRERERERVFPENARAVRFIVFVDFENANNASTVKMSWTILLVRDPVDAFPAETRGRNDSAAERLCRWCFDVCFPRSHF